MNQLSGLRVLLSFFISIHRFSVSINAFSFLKPLARKQLVLVACPQIAINTRRLFYSENVENLPVDGEQVKQLAKETTSKRPRLPNLYTALTTRDFDKMVKSEHDRDTIVRYYAPWCRACKKSEPLFFKLARDNPKIKFVQVPILSTNGALIQQIGVTEIPWGQIYRPRCGLYQEFEMNCKNFVYLRSLVSTLA